MSEIVAEETEEPEETYGHKFCNYSEGDIFVLDYKSKYSSVVVRIEDNLGIWLNRYSGGPRKSVKFLTEKVYCDYILRHK